MRPAPTLVLVLLFAAAVPAGGPAAAPAEVVRSGDAYGRVAGDHVVLGNDAVERRWRRGALATTRLRDKRTHAAFEGEHADFGLVLGGVRVASDAVPIAGVGLEEVAGGGVRARFTIDAGVARIVREVEVYPGIAGFQSRTRIEPLAPLVLSGYSLDEVAVGEATPTITAFRAGADWREPGWAPQLAVGDPHTGDWRETRTAARGQALEAPGEWLSMARPGGERVFMVMERRDYASSRMAYDGAVGSAVVDLSRDVIYIGPFEEDAHAENPAAGPARHRVLAPGRPLELEGVFTGLGRDADDEPWQWYQYLTEHRLAPYPKAVTFNTDQVDENDRSTGTKDDVDYDRFLTLLDAAREMGVETFIFDDGWMARSGDWCPDAWPPAPPECQDPRWDGTATSKLRPRFPDDHFGAVQEKLAGDPNDPSDDIALGLWMNPMEFNPAAIAFRTNPQWACAPVGDGTAAVNAAQPDDGSNEAGIGVWNPEALGADPDTLAPEKMIDFMEGRIRRAIEVYGARYFKFDFLVWIDCAGVEPTDMYGYHDSFVSMLDRVQADHPDVTLQIDDTNDYRMFPFETIARGPSWFVNGSPSAAQQLHNVWDLAPYIPGFAIGQRALNGALGNGIDRAMAVALPSHLTFSKDIDTELTPDQRAEIKKWTDFYKAHRDTLATFTYPLLADPSGGGWTALQPWDPDAGRGWLLAYRQGAPNATQAIPLRGVPDGTYELTAFDPAISVLGVPLGQATAAQVRAGLAVTIAGTSGYAIIEIEKVA